ncbi:SMP-30/gluconolactonase/LRE family protein [Azospirillum halopraeferens]|uniref:SMP-30/gluconolactonase/LRE family protein n=1 Tax=Azospirillum halopraeferens TaxID=34010 RepID=UPI000419856C|nr:SMP-30/gluconolactonase/LRE family protein [Azospirillum halopraeferens]
MRLVADCACELGEGALWHPERGELLFVDILGHALYAMAGDGSALRRWSLDGPVSALGRIDRSRVIAAGADGFLEIDLDTGAVLPRHPLEAQDARTRSNDGRVDRHGAFWVGTMGRRAEPGLGTLYRYDGQAVTPVRSGLTIPNACCFSADGGTGYFADTAAGVIRRWPLDPASGLPAGPAEVFVDLSGRAESPDGAIVDAEDHVWCALWGGGRVVRYRPDGSEERSIPLPVSQPSCPALGGPDLRTLYVTTAREGFDDARRRAEPHAGGVFAVEVDVPGLPEPPFRGAARAAPGRP